MRNKEDLQGRYTVALSQIPEALPPETAKRQSPIFTRQPKMTEQQAIQHAADALNALWKTRSR